MSDGLSGAALAVRLGLNRSTINAWRSRGQLANRMKEIQNRDPDHLAWRFDDRSGLYFPEEPK